jgi:ABC-type antimicrobial peptide transport system permease subunit
MTNWTLARRSAAFYFKSHLGTLLGAAIATAVLTGALLVGDSVRGSLRVMALARIGNIDVALATGDRLFRAALANELQSNLANSRVVPALQLPATVSRPDGVARANQVQVTGVDDRFWQLAGASPGALGASEVFINDRLARQLKTAVGETILIRVPRISHLSRDAPLSPEEDTTVALRLEVGAIVNDNQFGRFGLAASQVPPLNAFVPIQLLQSRASATNQANLLLISGATPEAAQVALGKLFRPEDAQFAFRPLANHSVEVRSPRVFLDPPLSRAALAASTNASPIFTYFVNQLRFRDRATPYSMVSGTSLLPLADNEIAINQWLAEDLQARVGDEISVSYYIMGLMRELIERTNSFRVARIVPMELPFADPGLMPDFPGMTDADNCRDWDTGFPINTEAIRDKDEVYWDQYRGTPKAFINLAVAQRLWSNRFGDLTAVRYPNTNQTNLAVRISANLTPESLGFSFLPIREQALAASSGAQDFGGLFIGFSFFLIAAALMLMLLLFRFALEQRSTELGTLLALGFRPKQVSRLLVAEGFVLAVLGAILGTVLAIIYAKTMLYGLSTVWSDAVAGATLRYHGSLPTLLTGLFSGILVAIFTIWWSLRKEGRRPARELLSESLDNSSLNAVPPREKSWRLAALLILAGAGLAGWGIAQGEQARADLFFGAGALILIGGILLASSFIRSLEFSSVAERLSLTGMGIRSVTRRRTRSRAAIALLACGSFLIASIGAFRLDANSKAHSRSSGTAGFALIGETSIPVVQNLNADSGRDFFGLSAKQTEGVQFVPFRVLEGEDASCLNLNRAQRPRLLGVNATHLADRKAFTFSKTSQETASPWSLLDADFGPDIVPAIGDAASIQWALGKKVGDDLIYLDGAGRQFRVRIVGAVANSILQGNLVISEKNFVARFPHEAGYRMFLIDAPSNSADKVAETLSKALQDVGFSAVSARERLAAFNAVQNTYLGTFQMLGGLGLVLGSFGLGVILLRNVFERRSELALLLAVGFRKPSLKWLILSEHAALLVAGLLIGIVAAIIAVLPSVLRPGAELPIAQLSLTLSAVFLCGLVWTIIAAARALRRPLLTALRNE